VVYDLLIVCALGVVCLPGQSSAPQILELDELRFRQIDALDRERTMFTLPIGMLQVDLRADPATIRRHTALRPTRPATSSARPSASTCCDVSGRFRADQTIQARANTVAEKHFSAADIASFGLGVHAGVGETSVNLAPRPSL
jgi:hypothetical protein